MNAERARFEEPTRAMGKDSAMKRPVLYSGSKRASEAGQGAGAPAPDAAQATAADSGPLFRRLRTLASRRAGPVHYFSAAAVVALIAGGVWFAGKPPPRPLTQADIDAAVLRTLSTKPLPSRAAAAAERVRPSVVRVKAVSEPPAHAPGTGKKPPAGKSGEGDPQRKGGNDAGEENASVGSGVVIVDNGTIVTNLHVVRGARQLTVTFHDGTESQASLVSIHPENDLAVIRAHSIPDDLPAATLGSASRLKPGDEVVAVGFPFGIGPSVSYGVVSGLNREFRSTEGQRILTRLIQFDAAANPGSSGGPLVTMQGDVVGIVTAILNPTEAGTFLGIGFAVTIATAAGSATGMHPF